MESNEVWRSCLDERTQILLGDTNGDVVPEDVAERIVTAGGHVEREGRTALLADADVDWCECEPGPLTKRRRALKIRSFIEPMS